MSTANVGRRAFLRRSGLGLAALAVAPVALVGQADASLIATPEAAIMESSGFSVSTAPRGLYLRQCLRVNGGQWIAIERWENLTTGEWVEWHDGVQVAPSQPTWFPTNDDLFAGARNFIGGEER